MGVDFSAGELTPEIIRCWRDNGVSFAVVRAANPYDIGAWAKRAWVSRQLAMLAQEGMPAEVYAWLYWWVDPEEQATWAIDQAKEGGAVKVWPDVEPYLNQPLPPITQNRATLRRAVKLCQESDLAWGLYGSRHTWGLIMGDSDEWADADLWDATYDGVPDLETWNGPYGGWVKPTMKQYQNDVDLCGIRVDWNVR